MSKDLLRHWGWYLSPLATGLFLFIFLLMASTGTLMYRRVTTFQEGSKWVAHTHEMLTRLETIEVNLVEAGMGNRGYLLTGEEIFLTPFHKAVASLPVEMASLREKMSDNPRQIQRIAILEPLLSSQMNMTRDVIQRKAQDRIVEQERLIASKKNMDEIRQLLKEMDEEEKGLLEARLKKSEELGNATLKAVGSSAVINLFAFVLAVLLVNRSIERRQQVETLLRQAHDDLEDRVQQRTSELSSSNQQLLLQIEERQRAQQAQADSEFRYRRLIELNPDGIFVNRENQIIFANETFLKILAASDPSQVLGRSPFDFIDPSHHQLVKERLQKLLDHGEPVPFREETFLRLDGKTIDVEVGATSFWEEGIRSVLVIVRDTSQRRVLENQLRQSQKMEAIGQLAGGVAHDFNNLLTVISGYSEMMLASLPSDHPHWAMIQGIYDAGERAAGLTRQLLTFSRKQVIQPQILNLNTIILNTEKMLCRLIGEDITVASVLSKDLAPIKADPGQIEQILLNLAVNARDAMPQGGNITIETANVELDEIYTSMHAGVQPGSYVLLAVSDTGTGMSEETKSHIFEPFYTTKGPGKGTGLGLATVYGIVKQTGGHIWLYSELGRGTTFKIYFPAIAQAASNLRSPSNPPTVPSGNETILLAEDDDKVRAMARIALSTFGYTVLEVPTGEEALRVGENHSGPVHLLLTDVVMPGLSGRQLAEGMQRLRPTIRVLYMSGYMDDAVVRHGVLHAETAFLQKPFTMVALAKKVRAVLDGK